MIKSSAIPDLYKNNWTASEFDPNTFVTIYISPDPITKPLKPTKPQEDFMKAMLSGQYDEGWFAGGNSSGKTWTARFMGAQWAAHKIKPGKPRFGSLSEFETTPYNILCTGPESKQAMELWEGIEQAFKNSPFLKYKVSEIHTGTRRNIHPYIRLKNGAMIEAVGLHDKGKHVEGQAYDLVLINEPPDVRNLVHCIEKVLLQRTWRRGGIICGFGTPKGKGEYFNFWRRGQKELDGIPNKYFEPTVYSQIADSRSNPYADQDKIERSMEGKSDEWVLERVEGRFTDSKYAAFRDTDIEACIAEDLSKSIPPSTDHMYVTGVDFGRKGDFTAAITWDVSVIPHAQVNIYRAGGGVVSWENIFEDLLNIYKRYGGEFIVDATASAGDMQTEWLADLSIPYMPYQFGGSPAKKVALINNLQDYISKRLFRMAYDEYLVEELRMYPIDMEDKDLDTDMVMALALVAWGAKMYEPLDPIERYVR